MSGGRLFGYIVLGCVAIAAAQAAFAVVVAAIALALLISLLTRPAETLGTLCLLGLLSLMASHPVVGIVLAGAMMVVAVLGSGTSEQPDELDPECPRLVDQRPDRS